MTLTVYSSIPFDLLLQTVVLKMDKFWVLIKKKCLVNLALKDIGIQMYMNQYIHRNVLREGKPPNFQRAHWAAI